MNLGIDYSCGNGSNRDSENNIRYGVISAYKINGWFEESQPFTPDNLTDEELEDFETQEYFVKNDELIATQNVNTQDIFLIKSKYFTYSRFCSPCAPGACYLTDAILSDEFTEENKPENNKCYCFGPDWFENENNIPYDIYEVETGNLIFKKIKKE